MLFDGKTKEQRNKALASAIHTVNFISQELAPFVENKTGIELDVRIGIDFGNVIVGSDPNTPADENEDTMFG